jgi:hypothetical protein
MEFQKDACTPKAAKNGREIRWSLGSGGAALAGFLEKPSKSKIG